MTAAAALPPYAELRCVSNFSFLRGASWPEELVERAQQLGYSALALTDECSLAGAVRAHVHAKKLQFKLLVGSQFTVRCEAPFVLTVLACNLNGYGNLCEFITLLRRTAPKGSYALAIDAIDAAALADCLVMASPGRDSTAERATRLLDASGNLVTPGLVDLHTHVFPYGSALGLPADELVPYTCTTTAVSAGDAGANNIAALKRYVAAQARTRIYAFVHIANFGLAGFPVGEMLTIDHAEVENCARAVAKPALRHRIALRPEVELEGATADGVLDGVLAAVPVPR